MTIDTLAKTDAPPSLMEITARPPAVFVRGEGSWLIDDSGKRYLDFVQGWAVNCLGHCPPVLQAVLQRQASTLMNCSPAYYNAPMLKLAEALTGHSGLDQVFFANSGAEANEGAIKLARKWGSLHRGGAYEIITTVGGFHGRTLATMSASGKAQWQDLFEPKVPGFVKVPFNDLDAVKAAINERTVAVMVEPIQGEAGVIPADDGYLTGLRELTAAHGILLILDEIQTGMGRTGRLFHYQHIDLLPDIMTLGKGLGGGVPLAALLARADVSCFAHGDQGGTFNGNPLMTAVGLAVLETVADPAFLRRVVRTGDYLAGQLRQLSERHGQGEVRGRGLLLALELTVPNAPAVAAAAFDRGLLINAPRPTSLRFMPALTVDEAEVDHMIDVLDRAISDVA